VSRTCRVSSSRHAAQWLERMHSRHPVAPHCSQAPRQSSPVLLSRSAAADRAARRRGGCSPARSLTPSSTDFWTSQSIRSPRTGIGEADVQRGFPLDPMVHPDAHAHAARRSDSMSVASNSPRRVEQPAARLPQPQHARDMRRGAAAARAPNQPAGSGYETAGQAHEIQSANQSCGHGAFWHMPDHHGQSAAHRYGYRLLQGVRQVLSPHWMRGRWHAARVIVVHGISLPAGQFGAAGSTGCSAATCGRCDRPFRRSLPCASPRTS